MECCCVAGMVLEMSREKACFIPLPFAPCTEGHEYLVEAVMGSLALRICLTSCRVVDTLPRLQAFHDFG